MKTLYFKQRPHRASIGKWSAILLIAAGTIAAFSPPLQAATDELQISDFGITANVEEELTLEKGVFPNDLDVSTSHGIVTISGSADNLLAKERAVKIAESIRGVMGVIDRTTVTPEPRPDEDIRRDILMALLQDPATDSYQVAVSVKDAVATLTGSVGSRAEKRLAARVAEGVKGIKEIRNDITINYSSKRTDKEIAADVNARLQWDVWLNSYTVSATVTDGKVTLTGTVGSAISKSRAFNDAWLNGVMDVNDSGVQIQAWGLNNARQKFKSAKVSDGEIKGAVMAALRLDPRVSAFSPDVTVEDGVVILGGVVGNLKAKTAAEKDAKDIIGVWETDNLLKVRPNAHRSDSDLEGELKAALRWDSLLNSHTIDVAVINRVAYLSGAVDSNLQKAEAKDVASRIKGVLSVRNHLKVDPGFSYHDWPYYPYNEWPYMRTGSSYSPSESFGPRPYLTDEQIKKKIERAFFWSPFVHSDDIIVTVHGGVAILTGTVGSWLAWGEVDKDARKIGAGYVINRVELKNSQWF